MMSDHYVFTVFNKCQTEELVQSPSRRDTLRKILKFSSDSEKNEILLDCYDHLLTFCTKQDFTLEKISCSLGIVHTLIQSSLASNTPVSAAADQFSALLTKHSIQRPPYSVQVFSQADIAALRSYMAETYFKHYFLYSYGFTPHKDLIITTEKLACAVFPAVLGLAESTEIHADSVSELKDFLPRIVTPKEIRPETKENQREEHEEESQDPVQIYLNNELKAMKALIDERVKKQDEEITNKIELLKK
jgi:hypothetical protein